MTAYRWRTDESDDTLPYSHHPYAYALGDPILLTDPTGKYVYTDPEDRRPANPCASIRDQQDRFLCEYHRQQQEKSASGDRNEGRDNYECIGNPGAVEVRIPLAGGGEAPTCLNAPQTEFEREYAGRQPKPKQLGIIEIIKQTCGILFAATENGDEEEEEGDPHISSNPGLPSGPGIPKGGGGWDPNRLKSPASVAGNTNIKPSDQGSVSKKFVLQYAEEMRNGTFNWRAMNKRGQPDPIIIIRARNGMFLEEGHHRFLASRLAGVEIPNEPGVIMYRDLSFDWPMGTEWTAIQWR